MAGIKQPVDTIIELSLLLQPAMVTNKGGSCRLEKSHKVWMMVMIAASLMWAGAAEKPEHCSVSSLKLQ